MKSALPCSDRIRLTRNAALFLSAAFVLSACGEPGVLINDDTTPEALSSGGFVDGADGLTVGHRLMAAGEPELALKAYLRAGTEIGINADVLSGIGSAQLKLGRLNQAEQTLRQAIDMDERFVPAWNNLAVVLYSRGELGEAREALRVAFGLDNGRSDEIRENLNRLDAELQNVVAEPPTPADFRLVRRGNGRYLLLGNDQ